jgi:hypothetical protein
VWIAHTLVLASCISLLSHVAFPCEHVVLGIVFFHPVVVHLCVRPCIQLVACAPCMVCVGTGDHIHAITHNLVVHRTVSATCVGQVFPRGLPQCTCCFLPSTFTATAARGTHAFIFPLYPGYSMHNVRYDCSAVLDARACLRVSWLVVFHGSAHDGWSA